MYTVAQAIEDIKRGRLIVVLDGRRRENEGDLVGAAALITPATINFMITRGRGLVCAAITRERAAALRLVPMVRSNTSKFRTNFTVSVDARRGTGSGISVFDRARTVHLLARSATRPGDLARPGHVFPLVAHPRGVLGRAGHTEAAVELARLAGLEPVSVLCEILNAAGRAASRRQLVAFAKRHRLGLITIAQIIAWRRTQRVSVRNPHEI